MTAAVNSSSPNRLVRPAQLRTEYGIDYSRMTLWRKAKDGTFPAPIKLSAKCIAWKASAIEAWIAEREAASLSALEAA